MQPIVHWECVATGRVQGVNYRARVLEAALRHRLVGTVENLPDGTVWIDARGPLAQLEDFLREVSTPLGLSRPSLVRRVREVPLSARFDGFEFR